MTTPEIQQSVSLQALNTLAVPAKAAYFLTAISPEDIEFGVSYARQNDLSLIIIGEGSNTVFVNDFSGLVIHNQLSGIELVEETDESVLIRVAAGENWHQLVAWVVQQGWYGIENLALIPGLVGAAPIQNIGAYGVEFNDVLERVRFYDLKQKQWRLFTNKECKFGYRDSIFKQQLHGQTIIAEVSLRLNKSPDLVLDYPALQHYFSDSGKQPELESVYQAVCKIRKSRLPVPADIPNAGSFFKNPVLDKIRHDELKQQFPNLVSFKFAGKYKIAAAWLIEQAGWKQKSHNGVLVYPQQALVIVNPEKKSGRTIIDFASAIQKDIKKRFDIDLDIEPRVV